MPVTLLANDPADDALARLTQPSDWATPKFDGVYTLVAVGAGAAGLVSAGGTGGLGGRAALVEKAFLGGDCLTAGCVPSKALLAASKMAHAVRAAHKYGVTASLPEIDFGAVMARLRGVRAGLAPADSAARFRDEFKVDVYLGDARFTGPDTLEVNGRTLRFKRAVIATGSRPAVPPIDGLKETPHFTNETIFALTELPERLIVLGGGPVGSELSQAFARLGSRVTIVTRGEQLLPKDEPEAGAAVRDSLISDGVDVRLKSEATRVEAVPGGVSVHLKGGGSVEGSHLLIAVGRTPTVENLGLEAAGVAFDPKTGVLVNDQLRTSNPRIYAAGDVAAGGFKFTHAADATARLVLRNALFPFSSSVEKLVIPWCTFTDPEVGRVGLSEAEARVKLGGVRVFHFDYAHLDRAATESAGGFLKLIAEGDTVVGATAVGPRSGELIGAATIAMTHGIGLKKLAATVFPYPTYGEALKKVADEANRARLTPWAKKLIGFWLGLLR